MRINLKQFALLTLVILTLGALSALFAQVPAAGSEIKLSAKPSVIVDGKIEENEWKDSAAFDLKGGGRVFFSYDREYLYVGVCGAGNGWSHLYIDRGGAVSVLHASAALGMTVYSPDKAGKWQPSNPFAWDLRDRQITAETRTKMNEYLLKNLWVANNANMGTKNEIEFKVKLESSSLRLAVVYAADAKNPQFFPSTLADDTLAEKLIYGSTPPDLKFDTGQWAAIILEKKK